MDINMKDVKIMKNENDPKDKWVYISKDETVKNGTRILYDDGKTALEVYNQTFIDFYVKGQYEIMEDMLGTVDFIKNSII